jgi:hypothetical protein
MGTGRYKKIGRIYVIVIVFLLTIAIVLSMNQNNTVGIVTFSPVENMTFDIIFLILLTMGSVIAGSIIGGYILAPLFLIAQKNTVGRKMVYGIQESSKPEMFKKAYIKSVFPALLALNFSLMLSDNVALQSLLVQAESVGPNNSMLPIMLISALFPLMGAIGMGLFSPVWFLQEGGIIYTNKEKAKGTSDPIEIRSVGGWYLYILKGYAGIGVMVSFYTFISEMMNTGATDNLLFLIIWPFMPFFLAFLYMPGIIALDMTYEKRKQFVIKTAEKYGITQKVEPLSF